MRAVAAGVGYGVVITARGRKAMASLYAARVFRVNVRGRIQPSTRAAEEGVALGSPEGRGRRRREWAWPAHRSARPSSAGGGQEGHDRADPGGQLGQRHPGEMAGRGAIRKTGSS